MIPRTKVNYGLRQLADAFLIGDSGPDYRSTLISLLQDYLGERRILLTASGRGGLYFILRASNRPRVAVPAYTCNAVVEAAQLAGKEVVYVEVDGSGYDMSAAALEEIADEDTVVIATHQFGVPCRIEKILEICNRRKALVVEDAAASLGSRVHGRLTGTFGDASFFSFDSTKLVNVPLKAGFIAARDPELFERIRQIYQREIRRMPPALKARLLILGSILVVLQHHLLYRLFHFLSFGLTGRYTAECPTVSHNLTEHYLYEMENWQAYIAAAQVAKIEALIRTRQSRYSEYLQRLKGCRAFELPPADVDKEWACVRFPIRVHVDKFSYYRRVARRGVDCAFSFTFITCPDNFTNARTMARQVLDLPYYCGLTDKELSRVVSVLSAVDREV